MNESMIPQVVPGMTKECGPEFWAAVYKAQNLAQALVKKNPGAPNRKGGGPRDFAVSINKSNGEIQYDHRPMWWHVSVEDFIAEQRRVCSEAGLVIFQFGKLALTIDQHFGPQVKGLRSGFVVVHAETGQGGAIPFEVPIGTNKTDAQDGYSWAESYFLRSFLRIARVDDKSKQVDIMGTAHEYVELGDGDQGQGQDQSPQAEWLYVEGGLAALCSVCEQTLGQLNQQFMTQHGPSCVNGHGGAQWVLPPENRQPQQHQAPLAPPPQQQQGLPFQGQQPAQQGQHPQGAAQHGPPPGGAGQPQQPSSGGVPGQSGPHGGGEAAPPQQQSQLPQQPAQPHGGHGAPAQGQPGPGPAPEPSPGASVVAYAQQALDSTLISEQQMAQETAPQPPQEDWVTLLMNRGWDENEALQLASVQLDAPITDSLKLKVSNWAMAHFKNDKASVVNAWAGTGFQPQTGLPAGAQRTNPSGLAMLKYLTTKITKTTAAAATA